ncbi:MAG: hypothetical protein QM723_12890 [Myxococcaceae bacterium]
MIDEWYGADRRLWRPAFFFAFGFMLLSSVGLVVERLAFGESEAAWIFSILITSGALFLAVSSSLFLQPSRPGVLSQGRRLFGAHLAGVVAAVLAVHLGLRVLPFRGRLIEAPAQLVNDAVLGVATLGLVWSVATRSPLVRVIAPVFSFVVVAGYVGTMSAWHVDPFVGTAVQTYVVKQILATAISLLIFSIAVTTRRGDDSLSR